MHYRWKQFPTSLHGKNDFQVLALSRWLWSHLIWQQRCKIFEQPSAMAACGLEYRLRLLFGFFKGKARGQLDQRVDLFTR
jgi:hypothetical protein